MRKVNCIYCTEMNKCSVKPRVFFGLFRPTCTDFSMGGVETNCELVKPHPRPTVPVPRRVTGVAPPPMPRPKPPEIPTPTIIRHRRDVPDLLPSIKVPNNPMPVCAPVKPSCERKLDRGSIGNLSEGFIINDLLSLLNALSEYPEGETIRSEVKEALEFYNDPN